MKIKGISPVTNQPFDQKDANNYGWMESENDLFEKYKHCDAFDYADLVKDFKEFKKENPELMPKPTWEQQADMFKAIKQMNLGLDKQPSTKVSGATSKAININLGKSKL